MSKLCAATMIVLVGSLLGTTGSLAAGCYPNCDYVHDYGPYDLTYIRPGLFAYPVCDWRGNCLPRYTYVYSRSLGGQIIIRPRGRAQ